MKDHSYKFAVEKMCLILDVCRSSYYDWLNSKPSKRVQQRALILEEIKKLHAQSKGRYGSPKIAIGLRESGFLVSRPRVARIMKAEGIRSMVASKFKVCTTDSNHGFKISANLLDRDFTPDSPSKSWVSDITYIRTNQGWLYLTIIMDLFDRKIVGWSMATSMYASETVVAAWKMAQLTRPSGKGLLFHSDRGVQYACNEFRNELKEDEVIQSMSRKGNCWDNAVAENFFKILKSETAYKKYESIREAKMALFEFIEIWYNRVRSHSALGYLTPEQFGNRYYKNAA